MIAHSDQHLPRLCLVLSGHIAQIPVIMLQVTLKRLRLREGKCFHSQVFLLIAVQLAPKFLVDFGYLEVFPQRSHAQHIVSDIDDLHQWVVSLGEHSHLALAGGLVSLEFQGRVFRDLLPRADHQFQVVLLDFVGTEEDAEGQLGVGRKRAFLEV